STSTEDPNAVYSLQLAYSNGTAMEHGGPAGCAFYGEKGKLHIDRGEHKAEPEALITEPLRSAEVHLPVSPGHHRDWLNCIRSRPAGPGSPVRPIADVEIGARSVSICQLCSLA